VSCHWMGLDELHLVVLSNSCNVKDTAGGCSTGPGQPVKNTGADRIIRRRTIGRSVTVLLLSG